MSQQYPQQPYPPQQPGWGAPPPPPKKNNTGKIIGFGCLGIVALIVIFGIVGALASSNSGDKDSGTTAAKSSAPAAQKTDKAQEKASEQPAEEKQDGPVAITAKKTAFAKSILADGSAYTSVLVTVTNNGDKDVNVNPLYFTITDTNGTKHTAELAADEKQIATVTLAPGENVSGTITGKGKFTAKTVTFVEDLIGDTTRANVS